MENVKFHSSFFVEFDRLENLLSIRTNTNYSSYEIRGYDTSDGSVNAFFCLNPGDFAAKNQIELSTALGAVIKVKAAIAAKGIMTSEADMILSKITASLQIAVEKLDKINDPVKYLLVEIQLLKKDLSDKGERLYKNLQHHNDKVLELTETIEGLKKALVEISSINETGGTGSRKKVRDLISSKIKFNENEDGNVIAELI